MELADLIVVMSVGRVEQIGKPQDIRARPATPFVRDFIAA
jgi:sulfate/thiosulfate transport system ATP-binding protein